MRLTKLKEIGIAATILAAIFSMGYFVFQILSGPHIDSYAWYLSTHGSVDGLKLGSDLFMGEDKSKCDRLAADVRANVKTGTTVECVRGSTLQLKPI